MTSQQVADLNQAINLILDAIECLRQRLDVIERRLDTIAAASRDESHGA